MVQLRKINPGFYCDIMEALQDVCASVSFTKSSPESDVASLNWKSHQLVGFASVSDFGIAF
jgi:hypothetical protein